MAVFIADDGFAPYVPARVPVTRCMYCGEPVSERNDFRTVFEAGKPGYAHRYCSAVGEAPRG